MKTIFSAICATVLLAGAAQAEVYHCQFNPKQTRGWAPANLYINQTDGYIYRNGGNIDTSQSGNKIFWRVNARSSGGLRPVKYMLTVGNNIESGDPVRSWLKVTVKGTQTENGTGTCQIHKQ